MSRVLRKGRKAIRVRAGSTEVSIYEETVRQRKRFTLAFYRGGARQRRTFANIEHAKTEARRVAASLPNGMHENADMTMGDIGSYREAVQLLRPTGLPLVSVIEEYLACRSLLEGAPLLPALSDYVRRNRGVRSGVTVPELVMEFLEAKAQDGGSHRYLGQLRSDLSRFACAFAMPVLHVKSEGIDDWIRSLDVAPPDAKWTAYIHSHDALICEGAQLSAQERTYGG